MKRDSNDISADRVTKNQTNEYKQTSIPLLHKNNVSNLSKILNDILKITYEIELEDWIRLNASRTIKGLKDTNKKTFIDKHGIKRYADSWLKVVEYEVDKTSAAIRHYEEVENEKILDFEKTGCFEVDVTLKSKRYVDSIRNVEDEKYFQNEKLTEESLKIRFLADWERLWTYLDEDSMVKLNYIFLNCFNLFSD